MPTNDDCPVCNGRKIIFTRDYADCEREEPCPHCSEHENCASCIALRAENARLEAEVKRLENALRRKDHARQSWYEQNCENYRLKQEAQAENARLRSRVEELENKTPLDRLTTFLETPIEEFEDEVPVCRCGAPSPDGVTCWKCLATQAESENARLRAAVEKATARLVCAYMMDEAELRESVAEEYDTLESALKEPGV